MVHQHEIESTGNQLVLHGPEASGTLWMAITHVVQRTVRVGNQGYWHVGQSVYPQASMQTGLIVTTRQEY